MLVSDYEEAIEFYVSKLRFELLEDTPLEDGKRWVRVAPRGRETSILLAKATDPEQLSAVGNQSGGRVWLFLSTDDFEDDYAHMTANRVKFLEEPRTEPYGKVAVFEDLYGNRWDLIQPRG